MGNNLNRSTLPENMPSCSTPDSASTESDVEWQLKAEEEQRLRVLNEVRQKQEQVMKSVGSWRTGVDEVRPADFMATAMLRSHIMAGDVESVKKAVPSVMSPNAAFDESGQTPLSYAVQVVPVAHRSQKDLTPYLATVSYLLSVGGDASFAIPHTDMSLLDQLCCERTLMTDPSAQHHLHTLIRMLVQHGADVNRISSTTHQTVMYWTIVHGMLLTDLSDLLLSLGSTVLSGGELISPPFLLCTITSFNNDTPTGIKDEQKILHLLDTWTTANPKVVAHRDEYGLSVLHTAAVHGMPPTVLRLLIDKGAEPSGKTREGATPYRSTVFAISHERAESTRLDRLYKCAAYLHPYDCPDLPNLAIRSSVLRQPWVEIGRGSYGTVYRVLYRAIREDVAVKQVTCKPREERSDMLRAKLHREIVELHACRCKFVLTLYGYTYDEGAGTLCMVTELCSGSLHTVLRKDGVPPTLRLLDIASQVGRALLYLHVNKRCHCSVAARSVLLTSEGHVKLGNFALACRANDLCTTVATRWASPEMLRCVPHRRLACTASDVWAFGVLLWEMLSGGQEPYAGIHEISELKEHIVGGGVLPRPENCPDAVWSDLVRPCFEAAEHRPTMSDLLEEVSALEARYHAEELANAADCDSLPTEDRLAKAVLRELLSSYAVDYGSVYEWGPCRAAYYGKAASMDKVMGYEGTEYGTQAAEKDTVYEVFGRTEPLYPYV